MRPFDTQRNPQKISKINVRTSLRDVTNAKTATKPKPPKRHFVSGAELQLGKPAKAKAPPKNQRHE